MAAIRVKKRKATYSELMEMRNKRATQPQNDCLCGCGGKCRGRFVPGHDSKLRGRHLRSMYDNPPEHPEHVAAKKHMIDLGWMTE